MREEQHRYRQYLAEQLEEQRRHEAETEQLIEAELQQTWNRRAEQNRVVKEARDRLMKDVMDTRRLQIQEKCKEHTKKTYMYGYTVDGHYNYINITTVCTGTGAGS